MNTRFTELVTYFENIARAHVAIQHRSDEKHFYRFELDELYTGLSGINYPALMLESYNLGFTDNRSDNVLKNRGMAFMLIGHVTDASDYDAINSLYDELETIGDDILARMRADKNDKNVKVIKDFDLSKVEVSIVSNQVGLDYGLRYQFELTSPVNLDVDASRWLTNSGS
jgi:hypothetical protein